MDWSSGDLDSIPITLGPLGTVKMWPTKLRLSLSYSAPELLISKKEKTLVCESKCLTPLSVLTHEVHDCGSVHLSLALQQITLAWKQCCIKQINSQRGSVELTENWNFVPIGKRVAPKRNHLVKCGPAHLETKLRKVISSIQLSLDTCCCGLHCNCLIGTYCSEPCVFISLSLKMP